MIRKKFWGMGAEVVARVRKVGRKKNSPYRRGPIGAWGVAVKPSSLKD